MKEFIEYLKNQKRIGIENGALQSDIDLLNHLIKEAEKQCAINGVSNAERTLAIKFADALLNDFEMSEFEDETLCWRLCGVPHKYTTSEVYDRYIDEILANDC